jgi:hypothetical protein
MYRYAARRYPSITGGGLLATSLTQRGGRAVLHQGGTYGTRNQAAEKSY